jgi:hypothetical protein
MEVQEKSETMEVRSKDDSHIQRKKKKFPKVMKPQE